MSVAISTLLKLAPTAPAPASVVFLDASLATLGTAAVPGGANVGGNDWRLSYSAPDGTVLVRVCDAGNAYLTSFAVATATGLTPDQANQLSATYAKTQLLTTDTPPTIAAPVAPTGDVTVYQGDDYTSELAWSSTAWPDLTGATVAIASSVRDSKAPAPACINGRSLTIGGAGTPTQILTLALTRGDTDTLYPAPAIAYRYQLIATLANGSVHTIQEGVISVRPRRGQGTA